MSVIACDCEIYEICPSCAPTPEHYEKAAAAYAAPCSIPTPESDVAIENNRYTLPEIEQLAHEFADDGERSDGGKVHVQATMLQFVEWVKAREKEA